MRGGEKRALVRVFYWRACVAAEVEADGGYLAVHAGRIINIDGKNYRPAQQDTHSALQIAVGISPMTVNYPRCVWGELLLILLNEIPQRLPSGPHRNRHQLHPPAARPGQAQDGEPPLIDAEGGDIAQGVGREAADGLPSTQSQYRG
jgi:hypothetical protein